jgi:hypothetical protein
VGGIAIGAPGGPGGPGAGVQVAGPEGEESIGQIVMDALGESGDVSGVDIEVEGEGPQSIAVFVQADTGGGDGFEAGDDAGGDIAFTSEDGDAGVVIAVQGDEDFELSEEVRQKLEEKAREMAEKIRKQMELDEAEGLDPGLNAYESLEERRRQHEELAKRAAKFKVDKARLRDRFVADVQSQLTTDQLEQWPSLERTLVREKTLPRGRLDAESTDVVRLVERLDLADDERQDLAELVDTYEVALHEALVRRNEFLVDANDRIDKAMGEGESKKALEIIDRAAKLRVAVRNVNRRYADALATALGDETGERLRRRFLEKSHPRIYRKTLGLRTFEAALGIGDLDPETREAIEQMEQQYRLELERVNASIREAILEHQPGEPRRSIEHVRAMMSGEEVIPPHEDDPIREAFRERSKLDDRHAKQVWAVLTPEQAEVLPPIPERSGQPVIIRQMPIGWSGDDSW